MCTLYNANNIAILQCTSSSSITTIIIANCISQNVFIHMHWHASEEKKEQNWSFECIAHIYARKTESSYHAMFDWLHESKSNNITKFQGILFFFLFFFYLNRFFYENILINFMTKYYLSSFVLPYLCLLLSLSLSIFSNRLTFFAHIYTWVHKSFIFLKFIFISI
jgi:hypothetical protein